MDTPQEHGLNVAEKLFVCAEGVVLLLILNTKRISRWQAN